MPLDPNERERRARHTDRRAASPKKSTDITSSAHPVVTKAVYDSVVRGASDETVNLKTKRLCQGKNTASKLLLLIDGSLKDFNPQVEDQPSATYNSLRQMRTWAQKLYMQFPLQIENK